MSNMKIKPEHYKVMRDEIAKLVPKFEKHRSYLKTDNRVQDIDKRMRWDALWATGLNGWLCQNVYLYANDEHIDTALRSIMAELHREEPCLRGGHGANQPIHAESSD